MQSFTRTEIKWISHEMAREAKRQKNIGELAAATNAERELSLLRAEQYQAIAGKLAAALEHGDKRIEIR